MAELNTDLSATEFVIETGIDQTGTPIVRVSGELDMSTADSLKRSLATITVAHPNRLIFDFGNLRFMDSAGIAVLLGVASEIDSVCLRNASPVIQRVIELTGLTGRLHMEP